MPGRCCLCELQKKRYLCPACFQQSQASRRQDVAALSKERDALLERLEGALGHKELEQRRALQQLQLSEEVRACCAKVEELEQRLLAIRQRTDELRKHNLERQLRLRDASQQLRRWAQHAQREGGNQMEALGHNFLRSLETLSREQRNRVVRRLLDILPVKLMTPGNAGGSSRSSAARTHGGATPGREEERAVVMICGLLLPDSRDDVGELVQLLPQLGSSLGYVALLLDVLSRFLQLPLLHRSSFQASTTRIWQPAGFFDMRTAPPAHALPLFPPEGLHQGHHQHGAYGSHAGGLEGLYSAVMATAAGRDAGAASEAAQAALRASLAQGLYLLQRSAGALVYARLGPDAPLKVPPDWSPLAVLGGLCKMLAAEPRLHNPLAASRVLAVPGAHQARVAGAAGLAASAVFGRLPPQQDVLGQSMLWPDEDGGDEEWDIIPRPSYGRMIPPPPSQPDDVEHWTQAMYPGAPPEHSQQPQQQQHHRHQQQQQQSNEGLQRQQVFAASGTSPVGRVVALAGALRTYMAGGG